MLHPDLKPLIWGRHLQKMLAALGAGPRHPQPIPRTVGRVPGWYRRVNAVLTVLGLVGALRWLDHAISVPPPPAQQVEATALASTAWDDWTHSPLPAPLDALRGASTRHRSRIESPHRFQRIDITAYSRSPADSDTVRSLTASNTYAAAGTIALSRDLLQTFTPGAPFDFGDKVLIPGVGIFEVLDTMHPRWKERADLWFDSPRQAVEWGHRTVFVTRVEESAPTIAYQALEPHSSSVPSIRR